jgi:1-acylglycerone phosphate reductase
MSPTRRSVLITGCSNDSLGSALALALHASGAQVIATARDVSKLSDLTRPGITTLSMDVCDAASITKCAHDVVPHLSDGRLDILINNAGGAYSMPIIDTSLDHGRRLFDINVWSCLAVTQAFVPLLAKAQGVVVNHTSIVGEVGMSFQGVYSASKAAAGIISEALRLELEPFRIKVVQLKSGAVRSGFYGNANEGQQPTLPAGSMYQKAAKLVEAVMRGSKFTGQEAMDKEKWAQNVSQAILRENPPQYVLEGAGAKPLWYVKYFLPSFVLDKVVRDLGDLPRVTSALASR